MTLLAANDGGGAVSKNSVNRDVSLGSRLSFDWALAVAERGLLLDKFDLMEAE